VLETEVTNKAALRLYENLGFVHDKRLFRYYLNGVDALRLKLWLRWANKIVVALARYPACTTWVCIKEWSATQCCGSVETFNIMWSSFAWLREREYLHRRVSHLLCVGCTACVQLARKSANGLCNILATHSSADKDLSAMLRFCQHLSVGMWCVLGHLYMATIGQIHCWSLSISVHLVAFHV